MTNKQQLIAAIALFMAVLWGMSYVLGQLTREHWAAFPAFITTILGMIGAGIWAFVSIARIEEERDKC
jgi:drug/metabolite transporter (DMT)-like permease